jgi:predicted ester cyclase
MPRRIFTCDTRYLIEWPTRKPTASEFGPSFAGEEAMSELDAFRTQEKTEEQNIETVREFLEAIDNGTHAERTDLFSADYICHFIGAPEPLTLEVQTEFITTAYKSLPDNIHIVKDAFAKGDKVSMRVINRGTQQGEWEGVPPTGKKYAYEAMWIFRLADGKIAEAWGLEDNLGFMQQLGMELKSKEEE